MFGRLLARRYAARTNDTTGEMTGMADGDGGRPVDRRNMLRLGGMAAAGAAGAALMTAVDASPAAAGVDGDVVLGADNTGATQRTAIIANIPDTEIGGFFQDASTGVAVRGRAGANSVAFPWDSNKLGSFGLYGESKDGVGVVGISDSGYAVAAATDSGVGAQVQSASGIGVSAYTASTIGNPAVSAASAGNGSAIKATTGGNALKPAVQSTSGATAQPAVQANGVDANAFALDVHGKAVIATGGLAGAPALKSTSGSGQPALQAIGKAVAANGTTVRVAGNAAALNVAGVAAFTRSNVVSMTTASTVVSVPGGLTAASHVLATMQTKLATTPQILAAVPNAATGKITIYLSAAPASAVNVAWFVFG